MRVCVIALPRLVVDVGSARPPHVGGCARGPTESPSMPRRKQFGPRKLHQSARGADGLKAVTFPAGVTGSYFTQSTHRRPPRAPCSSTTRLPHLRAPTAPATAPLSPLFPPLPVELLRQQNQQTRTATVMLEVENEEEEEEDAPISAVCRRRVRLYSRDLSLAECRARGFNSGHIHLNISDSFGRFYQISRRTWEKVVLSLLFN